MGLERLGTSVLYDDFKIVCKHLKWILANFITPKFYSHEIENVQNSTNVEEIVEKLTKEENSDPKECYRWPLLTSHT